MLTKENKFCSNVIVITFFSSLIALLSSCQKSNEPYVVNFVTYYNSQQLGCHSEFENQNKFQHQEKLWHISQLQLFIHNVELKDEKGQWHKTKTIVPAEYNEDVFLIGSACGQQQNWQIKLISQIEKKQISGIKFTVGVPQNINHKNPLSQNAPLNQPDMFWTWQLGHKFIRIELSNNSEEWIFHLGSTGCQSPSPVRPPEKSCKHPNTPKIILDNFSEHHHVALNLSALLKDIDMLEKPHCQSSLETSACRKLLPRVGIPIVERTENKTQQNNNQNAQVLFESKR